MENKYADVYKAEWSDVAVAEGTWVVGGPHFVQPYFPDDLAELVQCFKDAQYWGPRQMMRWRIDGRDFDCFYTFPEARMRFIRAKSIPVAQTKADCVMGRWKKGDFVELLERIDEVSFRGYVRGCEHVITREEMTLGGGDGDDVSLVGGGTFLVRAVCPPSRTPSPSSSPLSSSTAMRHFSFSAFDNLASKDKEKEKERQPFAKIAEFYARGAMCDVRITSSTTPGQVLCHRLILGTRSEVLKEILEDGVSLASLVELDCESLGISLPALRQVVDYFYFNKIELGFASAIETVKFVEKFAIEDETLEMVGKMGVMRNLNARNVASTWARNRHSPILNELCKRWVIKYMSGELARNSNFLCQFEEDDLACLLRDERVGRWCKTTVLFDGIAERNEEERRSSENLVRLLKLHEMTSEELAERRARIPQSLYLIALERKLGIPPSMSLLAASLNTTLKIACVKCTSTFVHERLGCTTGEGISCPACGSPLPPETLTWLHFALSNSCEFVGYG